MDTIIQTYTYKDGLLSNVQFMNKGTEEDNHTYLYDKNIITVEDKSNRMIRSYQFDKNNQIAEYWNDRCDKFTLTYADNKIKSIDRADRCGQYSEGIDFEYTGDKLSKVKTFGKKRPEYTTDYVFTYMNDTLKKIVRGNNIDTYILKWENSAINSIAHSSFGRKDWKRVYVYDNNSNIIEESYYSISNDKEALDEKYVISYSTNPGNDNIIWNLYDWKINEFLNQRTYRKFVQRRY